MFTVENGIPLNDKNHRGRMPKTSMSFPWESMQVGDSFFVPVGSHDMVRLMNKITASGRAFFGTGCVSARSVKEGLGHGIRVWRVN